MKRIIQETEDGSKTIYIEDWDESYHSKHGAVQEAFHVFIQNGLHHFKETKDFIKILEIGLGTGLNSFITLMEAEKNKISVQYVGIEKFPVSKEEFELVNYFENVFKLYPELEDRKTEFLEYYQLLFDSNWEKWHNISPYFESQKYSRKKRRFSLFRCFWFACSTRIMGKRIIRNRRFCH
jgi:tRNA U34 5-methylaminomethyl-2-thiouridine-forming methyltransferase MnmC